MKQALSSSKTGSGKRLFSYALLASASLLLAAALPAAASENKNSMLSRLDRIEQRIAELSAQNGSASDGASTPSVAAGGMAAAQLDVAIAQLREEMRDLRGQIEELSFQQQQLKSSMQRLEKDADLRLEALERQAGAPTIMGDGDTPAPTIDAPVIDTPADTAAAPVIDEAAASAPNQTDSKTANEAYQSAFDALNSAQYPQAEAQFLQFIQRYPDHNLIGNAHYWLGETYYVQQRHDEAAEQFRQGFQVLPEGPKAPENLLRLGMTLGVLERKDEACIIMKQLLERYKGRSESTLRKAERESEKLGCK